LDFVAEVKALTELTVFLTSTATEASCAGVGDEDRALTLF
jgi:hypothetical protein